MSRFEPGLLDKLFGDGAHSPASAIVRQLSLDELKGSVAHHIESLLNARITFTDERLAGFNECQRSVLTYGLNDFAGLSLASHDDRQTICNSIRRAIERHERRLKQVEVKLEVNAQSTNVLCFAIKAMLVVHPAAEPVSFDAMLQPATLQYSVIRARPKRL
ncbi:type VI secretion system baseplate subunit TssE [Trinickia dabaoshanensis]|uniref:Type VI secretion system baseplate subunit TssE n=1 Tax=Trinickia dabaoshanensis TaxID=564714 RepID=A0A2N7VCS4_9BURK|nr:type VI secretion system baseplate subunit TssE [Trinickia dabaoshanensis]PMS14945.1 type VI secretion system baseplate subunit TssE [Trinickia dabaoshanensis]